MPAIRIYEAAMCCDTGVCGADVDQALVTITADVRDLRARGVDIERFNLSSNPAAFVESEAVRGFLHTVGSTGLPVTTVDGVTVATGRYPTRQAMLDYAGLGRGDAVERPAGAIPLELVSEQPGACCGGTGCC